MEVKVNSYKGITPSFYELVQFEQHQNETLGTFVLLRQEKVYLIENGEWKKKYQIFKSESGTIYFQDGNSDLLIGKVHFDGFRVLKVSKFFDEYEKIPPPLVLEFFDEILQEVGDNENLRKMLEKFHINPST